MTPVAYTIPARTTLLLGDCLEVMAGMEAGSVDAVVTDPPYGLEFMGKEWDRLIRRPSRRDTGAAGSGVQSLNRRGIPDAYIAGLQMQLWHQAWAAEALRVLKPSHYLLAFGGTRTWHRLACAIEDAGFEIRDTLMWLYGSGFPKGKSCLKPAWEPIILARKPGPMRGLGIDECRILTSGESPTALRRSYGYTPNLEKAAESESRGALRDRSDPIKKAQPHPEDMLGRWPANLILECTCDETREGMTKTGTAVKRHGVTSNGATGWGKYPVGTHDVTHAGPDGKEPVRIHTDPNCPCAMLDAQSGERRPPGGPGRKDSYPGDGNVVNFSGDHAQGPLYLGESGGASRFFYCAKASRAERNAGCEGMEEREARKLSGGVLPYEGDEWNASNRRGAPAQNHHPTVKPLALMRWMVRLVAYPGDTVLDPFMGSGTTGVACAMERREFVGIERESDYLEIARARIDAHERQGVLL